MDRASIDILVPAAGTRRWQAVLAERLARSGHRVAMVGVANADPWPSSLDRVVEMERRLLRIRGNELLKPSDLPATRSSSLETTLVIDLTGASTRQPVPVLRPLFDGSAMPLDAARSLSAGRLPNLTVMLDDTEVAYAAPMVDSRVSVTRGLEDVLARAITLLAATVERHAKGELKPRPHTAREPAPGSLVAAYATSAMPRQAVAILRRMRSHGHHWRVGYRLHDGPGVADKGLLSGEPWHVLPDDGDRFYADPFPFERQGRSFIFVEEYPHATGKGVIAVSEIGRDGKATVPRKVLELPHHLSYPQVFARDGAVWMLPESGAGKNLVLYRAESFPDRWLPYATLMEGRELFDATLLDHAGRLWLFATERDGYGSASDTMVVFHADRLEGPWQPHRQNPIMIDRAAARPGGGFVRVGERIVLPVQDGTLQYGGGLGLSDLLELDVSKVVLTRPVPILPTPGWPYPMLHTLNRAGRLEVIDGVASVRKRGMI